MTTNAILLPRLAAPLAAAGPAPASTSTWTPFDPERLKKLMRFGTLEPRSRPASRPPRTAGLVPIKLNCVVTRDYNDTDVVELARRALERGLARALHRAHAPGRRRGRARRRSRSSCPSRETRERIEAALGPLEAAARARTRRTSRGTSASPERRGRRGLHQPGERALLRRLQPHAPHRRRQVPPLPAERRRARREARAARGRRRAGGRRDPGAARWRRSPPGTAWTRASPPKSARCSRSAASQDAAGRAGRALPLVRRARSG